MENEFEKLQKSNKKIDYYDEADKLVEPYIKFGDGDKVRRYMLAEVIGLILNEDNDDSFIEGLNRGDTFAVFDVDHVQLVKQALKEKSIMENAPWFKKLEERMLRFSIYTANADVEKARKKLEESDPDYPDYKFDNQK